MTDANTCSMAAIGGTVALLSAIAPRTFLRPFGIPPEQVTGAAAFGWRLSVRTAYISVLAAAASGAIIALDLRRRLAG